MTGMTTVLPQRPMRAPAPADLPRLLPPGDSHAALDLDSHLRLHGEPPYRAEPHGLVKEIADAGLTGRGGAAFPAAVKMTAVVDASARRRVRPLVVANGAEGEPASDKDKQLLWTSPHLVLDGLQAAALAVGARRGYLYVHRNDPLIRRLADALAARSTAGFDQVRVELVAAPPRFLAGEESALASRVGGGLARPTFKQPRVFERGAGGAPTLVQNVETLAHVALIARHGPSWFRRVGTPAEPGSMLVTCHRADGSRAVTEVPIGAPLGDVLALDRHPAQAVLAGGYHGAWITAAQAAGAPLANAALRKAGAAVGAGVLAALPADRCGLVETAHVVRYLAAESAGQCGPCLNGLPRIAGALTQLAGLRPDPRWHTHLSRWAGLMEGRGACHHPDGTVRLVRSALGVFADEIDRHVRGSCTGWPAQQAAAPFLPVPAHASAADPAGWR